MASPSPPATVPYTTRCRANPNPNPNPIPNPNPNPDPNPNPNPNPNQVPRRYSAFRELHARLAALGVPATRVPRFPPKRSYATQDEPFAARRREELNEYLGKVLADAELRACTHLHQFLELGLLLGRGAQPAAVRQTNPF